MENAYDLAIIGAGPGGYVAAIRASELGLKTVCIDKRAELGGTCLNVGCIPSKALLSSSVLLASFSHNKQEHGILTSEISYDFSHMMKRKTEIIKSLNQGIEASFKKFHVDHGQLMWGDFDMIFPIANLYEGKF